MPVGATIDRPKINLLIGLLTRDPSHTLRMTEKVSFFAKLNSTVILREQSDRRISLNKHNLHNKKQYDTINVYYEIVVKVKGYM